MKRANIKQPFFVFNPKSYLYGTELIELALAADALAKKYDISIFVTGPYADLHSLDEATEHIIVTAQHMDGLTPGRGMGHVLPESLVNAGVRATFLNHAEKPMIFSDLVKAIQRARELDIISIVCADSLKEAKAIAVLDPDVILCEPTELIGTGQTSDPEYVQQTNAAIKEINPDILVMQAAGISTPEDVADIIKLGADGTGCTSGITEATDSKAMLIEMIEALNSVAKG